jgi:hypothetical protein
VTVVYSIQELRKAKLDRAERSTLVNVWRDIIPCSCPSFNPMNFGDCLTCTVGKTILDVHGKESLMDFLDSVRIGTADMIEDKMNTTPFDHRRLRCALADMAYRLRRRLEVPTT